MKSREKQICEYCIGSIDNKPLQTGRKCLCIGRNDGISCELFTNALKENTCQIVDIIGESADWLDGTKHEIESIGHWFDPVLVLLKTHSKRRAITAEIFLSCHLNIEIEKEPDSNHMMFLAPVNVRAEALFDPETQSLVSFVVRSVKPDDIVSGYVWLPRLWRSQKRMCFLADGPGSQPVAKVFCNKDEMLTCLNHVLSVRKATLSSEGPLLLQARPVGVTLFWLWSLLPEVSVENHLDLPAL